MLFNTVLERMGKFSRSKRAMSPLIATILLISFAVALGAVVMNVGRTIGQEGPRFSECGAHVELGVVEIGGQPKACITRQGESSIIEVMLQNTANTDIIDLQINVIGSNDVLNIDSLAGSNIPKGYSRKINIIYDLNKFGNPEKITMIPRVTTSDQTTLCQSSKVELEAIGNC
ncbi:hypothetical protein KY320_00160 [Candidatus Woesearchaeota archaeon]|nr:hypothetical protein [Candidatus Woesearchaeota archaeon]